MVKKLKKWYKSRTLWVNIISIASIILAARYGFVLSVEEEAAILVGVNLIMRIITKEGLEK